MPKQMRGGSRGGRGRGRGRGGGGRGAGHSMGPGGDGRLRGRSISTSRGDVGRNDDLSNRGGVRKVRGRGGGGFGRRGNLNSRQDGPRCSPDNEDRVEEKTAATTPRVEKEKTALTKQSLKKGKKKGKEKEAVTVDIKQSKEMSMKKTPMIEPSSSTSPVPPQQPSPTPQLPPPVFASQDVRFKEQPASPSPAKSQKTPTSGIKNQTSKKLVKPPKPPSPSLESAPNEEAPSTPLSSPKPGFHMSNHTSHSTGLKVLSVTSSYPGYVFTTSDRARLVRTIPGVVIINTAAKGDSLIMGVDIEDEKLAALIPDMEKDKSWTISFVDTTERDVFSYLII